MGLQSYRELLVWQKGIEISILAGKLTDKFPKNEKMFGLGRHICKTADSISSNIAEGYVRQYTKEYIQFCYIALGSCAELDTQLIIAKEREMMCLSDFELLSGMLTEEMKMLSSLIRKLKG